MKWSQLIKLVQLSHQLLSLPVELFQGQHVIIVKFLKLSQLLHDASTYSHLQTQYILNKPNCFVLCHYHFRTLCYQFHLKRKKRRFRAITTFGRRSAQAQGSCRIHIFTEPFFFVFIFKNQRF